MNFIFYFIFITFFCFYFSENTRKKRSILFYFSRFVGGIVRAGAEQIAQEERKATEERKAPEDAKLITLVRDAVEAKSAAEIAKNAAEAAILILI